MMGTYGVLLPCDGSEPMPISVGDHEHINQIVEGMFDCVTVNVKASDDSVDSFIACGYINDTGLIDNLPINTMASLVFQRELRGNVVLVSGTSPTGDYDGDNHDVPSWFLDTIFDGSLYETSKAIQALAVIEAEAVTLAVDDGLFTEHQAAVLYMMMEDYGPKYDKVIDGMVGTALAYYQGRATGSIPKFDRSEYEQWRKETFGAPLTDEDIAKFMEENS